ncbi:MAG: hypothetical protein HS128_19180 [Ideonella sp.]|nr:hypothetical protein [Ideonella sp.]MCC7455986.1 hypothetical protein [Nitrospira sp.]
MAKARAAGAADKGLEVTAKRASFWRGGFEFGHAPRTIALAELTEAQAEAIRAESAPQGMLLVREVDIEPAKA